MATYYVDGVSGSDSNAGTSFGAAFATIGKAASVVAAGDTVIICATTTYTLTSTVTWSTTGTISNRITVSGANASGTVDGTRPTITSSSSGVHLFTISAAAYHRFKYLKFTHTGASRGSAFHISSSVTGSLSFYSCISDGCVSFRGNGARDVSGATLFGKCTILNSTGNSIDIGNDGLVVIESCYLNGGSVGSGLHGVALGSSTTLVISNSVIQRFTGRGIYNSGTTRVNTVSIIGCNIRGNGSSGVEFAATPGSSGAVYLTLANNISYGNGAYGVAFPNMTAAQQDAMTSNFSNAYGANTSGNLQNLSAGEGDVSLSGDPNTNAASDDVSLNNTAGAGASCRAAGFPGTYPNLSVAGYRDIGPMQHQDSGGGGSAGARLVGPSALVTPGVAA